MPMTRVQLRAFRQRFRILVPIELTAGVLSEGIAYQEVATSVPGRIGPKRETSRPVPGLGRSPADQIDTTDELRLPEELVADDGTTELHPADTWIVQLTSGGGPEDGQYYVIAGDPQYLSTFGKTRIYLCRRTTVPRMVLTGTDDDDVAAQGITP